MVETVQFDVGGKLFKVSRDLIDQHPETMLAKLISETWEKEPDKPVFIDRDGDLFSHVLNYLRYGSIMLPPSIPQPMFDRELDYYSITAPKSSMSQMTLAELSQHLRDQVGHHETLFEEHKQRRNLFLFAVECHSQFCRGCSKFRIKENNKELYDSCGYLYGEDLEVVNTYLEQYYGLKVEVDTCGRSPHLYKLFIRK